MQQRMERSERIAPDAGVDLFRVSERGARIAVRNRRARGEADDEIRRQVVVRFLGGISGDDFDEYTLESLVATVQRAVDDELARAGDDV